MHVSARPLDLRKQRMTALRCGVKGPLLADLGRCSEADLTLPVGSGRCLYALATSPCRLERLTIQSPGSAGEYLHADP
jgi:hypothetical protein